ncbi:IclR family transcriptional regulator [Ochrobactrum sp. XJ1]|nr:IclR family transcriptional regulator [Ochrobactrum sp. XJ1]
MSGTVDKALKILELLSTYDAPVRMADLARAAKMNKSTAYRMLETMSQLGYVQQDEPNGRYMITTKMWEIGVRAFQRLDIRAWSRQHLEKIRDLTGETSVLAIVEGNDVVIIEKCESSQSIQTFSPIGSRTPLHCSSLGKAYLMVDTDEKISKLKAPYVAFTSSTITTSGKLRKDIEASFEEGVCLGVDEFSEGVCGISAPVLGADGRVHAMVGITLPTARLNEKLVASAKEVIRAEANTFSANLGYAAQLVQSTSGRKARMKVVANGV